MINNADYDHRDGGFWIICEKCKQDPSSKIMDDVENVHKFNLSSTKGEIYCECMNCNRKWVEEWHRVSSTELGTIENYEERIKPADPELMKQILEKIELEHKKAS
jgi:hypothetical protein